MQTFFVSLLTLITLLTATDFSHAATSCEALFEIARDREPTTLSKRNLVTDEILEVDLNRDLLSQSWPAEGQAFTKSVAPFEVHHTEATLERTTVNGQDYVAVYHRWTPRLSKPRGTVLLQHGFSRSHLYFHDMTLLFLSLGYEVLAADGVNVGATLIATIARHKTALQGPSPVDDAKTWIDIVEHENIDRFITIGHSRGHAVTTLFLASGLYDNRLILNVALNPYVNWLVDQHLDDKHLLFEPKTGNDEHKARFRSSNERIRASYNQMAVFSMQMGIVKSFSHQQSHERVELAVSVQEAAATQIGQGLRGDNSGRRGFSVIPFYDRTHSISESDNGFGLTNGPIAFGPLGKKVLQKTHVIVSVDDAITKPDSVEPVVAQLPRGRSQLTLLQPLMAPSESKYGLPTSVPADHYAPSKQAFTVVARIDLLASREIARKQK